MTSSIQPYSLPASSTWRRLRVTVPATTANLGPGFDALGMALSLYNYIEAAPRGEPGLGVIVHGQGEGVLPTDATNLVARTFAGYFERQDRPVPNATLTCTNNIPLARGLGSSAAAIVGAVRAAAEVDLQLHGSRLNDDDLLAFCARLEGHPDNVAAALFGGLVVVVEESHEESCEENREETVVGPARARYQYLRIEPPDNLGIVVAIPGYTLSSAASRRALPRGVPRTDAVFSLGRAGLLVAAMMNQRLDLLGVAMEDRLHQPYREQGIPGFSAAIACARQAGAVGVALSGSGPSVVAFVDTHSKKKGEPSRTNEVMSRVGHALEQALAAGGPVNILQLRPERSGCNTVFL